ncbi:MAG: adenylate kinase [Thermofilum sp. ex4484_15]|nr:MAG: adenylate kinase [Thermofilum sp. ex4484_15]
MRVVVVAVPGAGKTTTLQLLKKIMPEVRVVNFGDFMFEKAKATYGIKDRDEMRKKLSLEEYRKLQEEAAKEISELPGDVVIDTHVAIKMATGYYPGLPSRVVKVLRPDVIVVMEFDPQLIVERRLKDVGLKKPVVTEVGTIRQPRSRRDIESPEEIELHQQMNRYFAVAAAHEVEACVKVLDFRKIPQTRPFEHAEIGAKMLADLIKAHRNSRGG